MLGADRFCSVVRAAVAAVGIDGRSCTSLLAAVPVAVGAAVIAESHQERLATLQSRQASLMADYMTCRMDAFEEKVVSSHCQFQLS